MKLGVFTAILDHQPLETALDYLQAHELNLQPRFDVAAVVVGQGEPSVEYLEDAFDGGGYELF